MIVLWNCHICRQQFDTYDGGICSRCKKPTCVGDLRIVGYDSKQGAAKWEQLACIGCIAPSEEAIIVRKHLLVEKD